MNSARICRDCSELLVLPPWLFEYGVRCTLEGHQIVFNLEHMQEETEIRETRVLENDSRALWHLARDEEDWRVFANNASAYQGLMMARRERFLKSGSS